MLADFGELGHRQQTDAVKKKATQLFQKSCVTHVIPYQPTKNDQRRASQHETYVQKCEARYKNEYTRRVSFTLVL